MAGIAKDGNLYPTSGVYGIDDTKTSLDTGWSSAKIMNKLANVKSIIRVDAKPTLAEGIITYVKDGTTYTTTDTETWFYYIIDDLLYKTTFIDGVEYTKDDSSVDFDDFVAKTDIVTTLDSTVTDEQVLSALTTYNKLKDMNLKTYSTLEQIGLDRTTFTLKEVASTLTDNSILIDRIAPSDTNVSIFPKQYGTFVAIRRNYDKVKFFFFPNEDNEANAEYKCGYHPNTGLSSWSRLITTTIADVSKVDITPEDARIDASNTLFYYVKNGVCNIIFSGIKITSVSGAVDTYRIGKVPVPLAGYAHTTLSYSMSAEANSSIVADVGGDGGLTIYVDKNAKTGVAIWGTLRYDVAE